MRVPELSVGVVVHAGEHNRPACAARRRSAERVAEADTFAREPVHVGCLDNRIAVTARNRRMIVRDQQQDVTMFSFRFLCEGGGSRGSEKLSTIHNPYSPATLIGY